MISTLIENGTLCRICTQTIDGEAPGYPRKCRECKEHTRTRVRAQRHNAEKETK